LYYDKHTILHAKFFYGNYQQNRVFTIKIDQIMKKYLFMLISIAIIMQSCGITQKQKEQATQDSLAIVLVKKQAFIDSIASVEQDIAVGNIKFGISAKEFDKESNIFKNKCSVPDSEMNYMNKTYFFYKLGDYGFTSIKPEYYKDSLYCVNFLGGGVHYEDYKSVISTQYEVLFDILETKYLQPTFDYGLPSWSDLESGSSKTCAMWIIGNKIIDIDVKYRNNTYSLNLVIYKLDVSAKVTDEDSKKEAEKKAESIKKSVELL